MELFSEGDGPHLDRPVLPRLPCRSPVPPSPTHSTTAGVAAHIVEDARVVVSELLGNALRHARPLPDGTPAG